MYGRQVRKKISSSIGHLAVLVRRNGYAGDLEVQLAELMHHWPWGGEDGQRGSDWIFWVMGLVVVLLVMWRERKKRRLIWDKSCGQIRWDCQCPLHLAMNHESLSQGQGQRQKTEEPRVGVGGGRAVWGNGWARENSLSRSLLRTKRRKGKWPAGSHD